MLKTKIHTVISGVLCAFVLGSFITAVPVSAATSEILRFRQDLVITNSGTKTISTPTTPYNYNLEAVTDPDILAVSPTDRIGVSAGVKDAVVLTTESIDFGVVDCEPGEKTVTSDIEMTINVEKFETPGIYRYSLANTTTEDLRYLDICIVTEDGELCVESYSFYLSTDFRSGNFEKSVCFTDTLKVIPPEDYDIVFRFVDTNGNTLAEDITFIETVDMNDVVPEKETSAQTGFGGVRLDRAIVATGADDAYSLYEETLTRVTGRNYTVVSDEIATHGREGSWRKTEQGEQSVYTVTFRANPTPTPPGVTTTGEGMSKTVVIGCICMVAAVGIVVPVIILKASKKTDDEVEGGQKK